MTKVWTRFVALLVVGLCAMSGSALGARDTGAARLSASVTRPALEVTTLDGAHFSLAAQRGKWVVVNYWATWCSPCIAEMPALSTFVAQHHDVTAIGLAYEDQPVQALRAFLKQHPVHYPVAQIDPAHAPQGIAMPNVLPTTFLIAPDGHLARTFVGPLDIAKLAAAIGGHAEGA